MSPEAVVLVVILASISVDEVGGLLARPLPCRYALKHGMGVTEYSDWARGVGGGLLSGIAVQHGMGCRSQQECRPLVEGVGGLSRRARMAMRVEGASGRKKRVALVTGGNRGLGKAVAWELGRQGLQVWVGARKREEGEAVAQEMRDEGFDAESLELDVESDASVGRLAQRCLSADDAWGVPVPDILINNAGVCLEGSERSAYFRSVQVNFFGALRVIQALAQAMRDRRSSCIVNVSSGEGELVYLCSRLQELLPIVDSVDELCAVMDSCIDSADGGEELAFGPTPSYSVSKAGLNALTRILACHGTSSMLGGGVGVRAVCPGDVDTRMCFLEDKSEALSPAQAALDIAWVALNPEECANGSFFRERQQISW